MDNSITAFVIEGYFAFEEWDNEENFEDVLINAYDATTYDLKDSAGVGFRIIRADEVEANKIFEDIIEVCDGYLNIRLDVHDIKTLSEYDGETRWAIAE